MRKWAGLWPVAAFATLAIVFALSNGRAAADSSHDTGSAAPIELVMDWYVPTWVDNPVNRCANQFVVDHPNIHVRPFSNLKLPGGLGGDAAKLMAFAGGIAPDLVQCWFHKLQAFKEQGFLLPLSEYVGEDRNGDGYISDDEAKWDGWKSIPPSVRRACTVDGRPYGVPFGMTVVSMTYRRDLVREITGSEEPPRTWDQFFTICQKLTQPATRLPDGTMRKGRAGFYADTYAFRWLPWLWSAGGEEVMQGYTSPTDGQTHWFPKDAYAPKSRSGEDLSRVKPVWRCTFASPEGQAAMEFYHRLFWQPWIRDENGEPVNLAETDLPAGKVTTKDGRTISFRPGDVIRGVSRGLLGDTQEAADELFKKGEICFYFPGVTLDALLTALSTSQIGFMSMPSPDGKRMTALQQPMWYCLNSALAKAPREKRDAAWQLMASFTGDNYEKISLQIQIEKGTLKYADPDLLRKFDMADHLADVPAHWQQEIREMKKNTHTEPFVGFWQGVSDQLIGQQILSRLIADPKFDYKSALKQAENEANNKVLRGRSEEEMARIRPWAWAIFGCVCAVLAWVLMLFWRNLKEAYLRPSAGGPPDARVQATNVFSKYAAYFLIAPALVLVLMWTYYPLAQGTVMAFQDYKVLSDKPFVGLDNFITVFGGPKFYRFFWITCKFVLINVALGFTAPIVLAILLNELPRGNLFFRMVFLLPQISAGLVIAYIWTMMYYPTEMGFFNAILLRLHLIEKPLQFLNDPNMALIWVTIPSVWAGVGGGSLLYLAALKTVPDDLYEAAEIDGAGVWKKLTRVTLPTLAPIILINFVGSFIGLFHSMGNIFLMTGGGPGEETTVLSLAIWRDSFLYLKFGTATATAWVLAALLVGFTVVQLRILSRVEFRRAEE